MPCCFLWQLHVGNHNQPLGPQLDPVIKKQFETQIQGILESSSSFYRDMIHALASNTNQTNKNLKLWNRHPFSAAISSYS